MTNTTLKTFAAGCLAIGMFACTPTKNLATRIDTDMECKNICERYATCYDPQYTVNSCAQECRDKARADGEFRRLADACNECMAGNACVETTESCSADCGLLVPLPPVTSAR